MSLRDVAIVGVYATEQAKSLDRTTFDISWEAASGALEDAGLTPDDVDGAAVTWPGPGGLLGDVASWGRFLGRDGLSWVADGPGATGGVRAVVSAAAAINAG
ncbi:MAG TPA: hypothetical protein VKD67_11005, partial [Acidimicrobiales bacterium]|nr:hypothetical protein [Acidimicrobiales bacterium]